VAHQILDWLAETGGMDRLRVLAESWLRYSEDRVFAGGCFFAAAAAEVGSHRSVVRDAVAAALGSWQTFVSDSVERAIRHGEFDAHTDAAQLTFEFTAVLDGANRMSLLFASSEPYSHARRAMARLLDVGPGI
jgi:hypothetical protein